MNVVALSLRCHPVRSRGSAQCVLTGVGVGPLFLASAHLFRLMAVGTTWLLGAGFSTMSLLGDNRGDFLVCDSTSLFSSIKQE